MATILGTITPRILAKQSGRSKRAIERAAARLGLPKLHGRYLWSEAEAKAVIRETHDGPGQPPKKKAACGGKSRVRKSPRK